MYASPNLILPNPLSGGFETNQPITVIRTSGLIYFYVQQDILIC